MIGDLPWQVKNQSGQELRGERAVLKAETRRRTAGANDGGDIISG
jgi:hypothetical protein